MYFNTTVGSWAQHTTTWPVSYKTRRLCRENPDLTWRVALPTTLPPPSSIARLRTAVPARRRTKHVLQSCSTAPAPSTAVWLRFTITAYAMALPKALRAAILWRTYNCIAKWRSLIMTRRPLCTLQSRIMVNWSGVCLSTFRSKNFRSNLRFKLCKEWTLLNSQSLLFSKLLYVVKLGFNISDGRIPSKQEKFSQDSWTFRSGSSDTESFEGKSLGKIKKFLVAKTDAFSSILCLNVVKMLCWEFKLLSFNSFVTFFSGRKKYICRERWRRRTWNGKASPPFRATLPAQLACSQQVSFGQFQFCFSDEFRHAEDRQRCQGGQANGLGQEVVFAGLAAAW